MDKNVALDGWRSLLGQEFVLTGSSDLEIAQRATFSTQQKVLAILLPADRREVQECVRIANQFSLPLYPISSGKNWGYGSSVPVQDNCVLLNLSRLNQIIEFNEDLAYVTLEPGVTQQQLYDFLQSRQSRLWMDATGSSPETSLIGNIMERGFGHTPYGDHFANVCGLEVILPTGELIHTGLRRFDTAQAGAVYHWGVGPVLDGLFSQSNLGIVTSMTVWLMPAPEYFQAFYFSLKNEEQLGPFINALRPLRLNGTIKSAVHIGNSYKVLSSIRQYPWEEMGGKTPLSSEVMANFIKTWDIAAWAGSGGLYGTKQQVAEGRRLIKKALKGKVDKLQFLDDSKIQLARKIAKPYQLLTGLNLPEMLKLMQPVYGLMKGIPTATQLASVYWRKKSPPPQQRNPDRDGCGLLWCSPVAPLEGRHAVIIYQIVQEILADHEFEPSISMTLLTERCLSSVISIVYDRDEPGEDQKAMTCYKALLERLTQAGYYPYRLGIQSMDLMAEGEENYPNLLKKLKESLDPNHILAPGRYNVI